MAEVATIARPYANAAFDLAQQQGRLAEWARMLGLLSFAVQTPEVQVLIGSPALADEAKAQRLGGYLEDVLDDCGRRFLQVLGDNKRLGLLPEIAAQFEARKAAAERVLDVEIVTAVELTGAQRDAYAEALARRFDREVQITDAVEPRLLGGAVIRAGDTVIDGSVRSRLARMADALQRA